MPDSQRRGRRPPGTQESRDVAGGRRFSRARKAASSNCSRLLGEPVTDLRGVSELLRARAAPGRADPGAAALLSPARISPRHGPAEAVVLLGSERLRILVLGCALADFAGRRLPAETVRAFWHHSLLTALLSQKIAAEAQPAFAEQAYFGGLLHDIGRLPLLIVGAGRSSRPARVSGPRARRTRAGARLFRRGPLRSGALDRLSAGISPPGWPISWSIITTP